MSGSPLRVVIIGVGNAYRGDDGAGLAVVRKVTEQAPAGIEVLQESGEGTALVEAWKGAQYAIVVDAIQSGAAPGTIRRIDTHEETVNGGLFQHSTHGFGIAGAIELARTLNELPPHLIIYGIEGRDFAPGQNLSPPVEKAISAAVAQVLSEAQRPSLHDVNVCVAAGCLSLHSDLLKAELEKQAGSNGSRCRVRGTGCMGLCSAGPLVSVEPDHLLYQNVKPEDAVELIRSVGAEPLHRLQCSLDQPFFKRQVDNRRDD